MLTLKHVLFHIEKGISDVALFICRCVPDYVDMDDLIGGPDIGDLTAFDFLYGDQQNEAISPAKFTNLNKSTGMGLSVFSLLGFTYESEVASDGFIGDYFVVLLI